MESWNNWVITQFTQIVNKRVKHIKITHDSRLFVTSNQLKWLNFTSNDYLTITKNHEIASSTIEAIKTYGIGSTGAPTMSGYTLEHQLLADKMAKWLGFDNCLLFSSGYQMNATILKPLINKKTMVWLDRHSHASLIDGVLLSQAKFSTFTPNTLTKILHQIPKMLDWRHLIVTEGTFSMDGSCTYLSDLIKLKQQYPDNILLVVDDAHGIGALGTNGHGTLEQFNLSVKDADLLLGTFSKSFASHGGFVCASKNLINYLSQTVRGNLFSTSIPPCIAAASMASLEIIKSAQGVKLRQQLFENIAYFKNLCNTHGLDVYNAKSNISPIQLLVFNDEMQVKSIAAQLITHNILVGKILYPTVKKSAPRIRISLTAAHTQENITILCETLKNSIHSL